MTDIVPAILFALFVWWFTTGLVLLVVLRPRMVLPSLVVAALLFPVSFYVLALAARTTSISGAYVAFSAAIVVWGTQEIAFLTGTLTGPRALPCPTGARGVVRLRHALGAILYHEIALILSGVAVIAVTWHAPNQVGTLTFLVLWVMRVSAKLNLFLGVPVLNDEFLPQPIQCMRSYFRRAPVNALFPVAIVLAVLGLGALVAAATDPDGTSAQAVGYTLVAALMGLAILEHVFMLVPLPIDRLWRWSTGRAAPQRRTSVERPRDGEIERVAATLP